MRALVLDGLVKSKSMEARRRRIALIRLRHQLKKAEWLGLPVPDLELVDEDEDESELVDAVDYMELISDD